MSLTRWTIAALAVILCSSPNLAEASVFGTRVKVSARLDAKVGLDDATKAFIEKMVPEVRAQVLKLLQEALPLIDDSVEKYLKQVDEILGNQLNKLQCTFVGTGKVLGADLASAVTGNPPEPLGKLDKDRAELIAKGFSTKDAPPHYRMKYADFLYRATNTACQVQNSPEAFSEALRIQNDVRPRWKLWNRLAGRCSDAVSCYERVFADVRQSVLTSDGRDLKEVGAEEKLTEVAKPELPGWFSNFNPSAFEGELMELLWISDSLQTAKIAREAIAETLLADATALIDAAAAKFASARGHLDPRNEARNGNAITLANEAVMDREKIAAALKEATGLSTTVAGAAATQRERFANLQKDNGDTISRANANISQIRTARAMAEMGQRLEKLTDMKFLLSR